jgi:hypothetical protein
LGTHNYTLGVGNSVVVQVWDAQTGAGPASKTVKVSGAATAIALKSYPNPSVYGEPVTFTAEVSSDTDADTVPDGETVSFMKGTTVLGKGTLRVGSASLTTTALEPGDKVAALDLELPQEDADLVRDGSQFLRGF